jgi:hypothetical protein
VTVEIVTGQRHQKEEAMEEQQALTLEVEFVDEPALWCWEVRDAASKGGVRSSWADEWMGYRTRDEACAAALTRIDEMLGRHDEARMVERLEECQLQCTKREVLGSAG